MTAAGAASTGTRATSGAGQLDLAGTLARRASWLVLAAVVATLLAVGSVHPSPQTRSSRISYLDSVIKCPVCDNISLAQSDAQQAQDLRAVIVKMVDAGRSNQQIERYVVAQFGTDELLRPSSPVIWLLPILGGAVGVTALAVVLIRRRHVTGPSVVDAADEALVTASRATARSLGSGPLAHGPLP